MQPKTRSIWLGELVPPTFHTLHRTTDLASEEGRQPSPLLETRHVFLDTQVYHGLKHNPANPAFQALAVHVRERRIVLHTSDITLSEVQRQLRESVAARGRELATIEKDLVRWRHAAPHSAPAMAPAFDAGQLGDDLFQTFRDGVVRGCSATVPSPCERYVYASTPKGPK